MTLVSSLFLGGALLAAAGMPAMPGEQTDPPPTLWCPVEPLITFDALDRDGSGSIDRPEFRTVFDANGEQDAFGVFDTDGDGLISREEFEAVQIEVEPPELGEET